MKTKKQYNLLYLIFLVIFSTLGYAQKNDRTELEVCVDVVENFNKQIVTSLFDTDNVVIIRASQYRRPACNIIIRAGANFRESNLLDIVLYRQDNSYEIYKKDKQVIKSKRTINDFSNPRSIWHNVFPWAKDGYYEYFNNQQIFHMYTLQGDYIIFTYFLAIPGPKDNPNPQQLNYKMQQLINQITQQIGY